MEPIANLNGEQMPLSEVKIPALDRGFLFGDAVYEVLRVYRGRPWLIEEHFQRLARSLESIRIGAVDLERLRAGALWRKSGRAWGKHELYGRCVGYLALATSMTRTALFGFAAFGTDAA